MPKLMIHEWCLNYAYDDACWDWLRTMPDADWGDFCAMWDGFPFE